MHNKVSSPYSFILSPIRRFFSQILVLTGLGVFAFGLFSGFTQDDSESRGALFIVDISLSMSVEDISDTDTLRISRLSAAKKLLGEMIVSRPKSLMTFASSAKLQLPLSTDERLWDEIVGAIEPIRYGSPTDIETALASAMLIYGERPVDIYILTDGERTSEGESLTGVTLGEDVEITFIGIGTTEGGKIINNYDGDGRIIYKKYEGKEILSRLDRDYIKSLEKKYDASSLYIEKSSDISQVASDLAGDASQKIPFSEDSLFFVLAAVLVLLGLILPDYRKK